MLKTVSVYQLCTVLLVATFHADDVVTLILFFYCLDIIISQIHCIFLYFLYIRVYSCAPIRIIVHFLGLHFELFFLKLLLFFCGLRRWVLDV